MKSLYTNSRQLSVCNINNINNNNNNIIRTQETEHCDKVSYSEVTLVCKGKEGGRKKRGIKKESGSGGSGEGGGAQNQKVQISILGK